MPNLKSTACKVCGKKLTLLQQRCGNVCDNLACRAPLLREQARREKQRVFEERNAIHAMISQHPHAATEDALSQLGLEASPMAVMVVPSFSGQLEAMTDERRSHFEEHLDATLASAASSLDSPARQQQLRSAHENYHSQETSLAVVNACSTCRGYCCKNGKNHAFLTTQFLAWRMIEEPQKSVGQLKGEYLELIPDQHYPDSCLFQSPSGCVLPRSIRSSTCNWFECAGIAEHSATLEGNTDHPTMVISHEAHVVTRIGIMNASGDRMEIDCSVSR